MFNPFLFFSDAIDKYDKFLFYPLTDIDMSDIALLTRKVVSL